MTALGVAASAYQICKDRLLADWPGLDEHTMLDTLEGITDLHEIIAAVIRSALVDEALARGLSSRIGEMKHRLARLEERGLKKRQLALQAMSEVGLKTLVQSDFTATARAGSPSLLVTNEQIVPHAYWLPQPPKLNRQGLLADLKGGRDIAGAQLNNAKLVLVVRTQ